MKFLDLFNQIPRLYNWYSDLSPTKRKDFNYIILLIASWSILVYNDRQHRENNTILTDRIDSVNNLRSKDQERYTGNLEYYTNSFKSFSEQILKQKEEIKNIKKDQ